MHSFIHSSIHSLELKNNPIILTVIVIMLLPWLRVSSGVRLYERRANVDSRTMLVLTPPSVSKVVVSWKWGFHTN